MTKKKLQVVRVQCGGQGQTVYLDNSTNLLYNVKGSIVVQESISKSCDILPIPLEYIEIDIEDEANENTRAEIPHISTESGREELSRNLDESSEKVQPDSVLCDNREILGGVDTISQSSDEKISSGTVSKVKPLRPALGTSKP